MAAVTAAIAGAGLLLSVMGQKQQAEAQRNAGKYNSDILKQKAKLAKQQSIDDEKQFRLSVRSEKGANIAQIGASGITLEGSPMEVLRSNASLAEKDAIAIRMAGENKKRQLRIEADFSRRTGMVRGNAQDMGATGSLLSGVANIAGSF